MKIYNSVSFVCYAPEFAVKDNGTNTIATIRDCNDSKDELVIIVIWDLRSPYNGSE